MISSSSNNINNDDIFKYNQGRPSNIELEARTKQSELKKMTPNVSYEVL